MHWSPPVSSVHEDSPRIQPEFSIQQGYWSRLTCPPPGDLPNPGIKPSSPTVQADSLLSEPPGKSHYASPFLNSLQLQSHFFKLLFWRKLKIIVTFKNWYREILYMLLYPNSSVLLLLLLQSLQSCPTLCDPIDGSPPGSPVLGFSRQEHWSGLPFPSPVHESEKSRWSRSVVSNS